MSTHVPGISVIFQGYLHHFDWGGGDLKGWYFLIKNLLGQGYRKQTTFRPCNVFICS